MSKMFEITRTPRRGQVMMLGILGLVLIVVGVLLLLFLLAIEPDDLGLLILPGTMSFVGVLLGLLFVQSLLARRVINKVLLELETPMLHLDDRFEFSARFTPRVDAEINGIHATFSCIERACHQAGNRSRTYTKVIYSETRRISEHSRVREGHPLCFRDVFITPPEGMSTFHGVSNAITWRLRIHIELARWPDVKEDFEVQVLPILGERPPGS